MRKGNLFYLIIATLLSIGLWLPGDVNGAVTSHSEVDMLNMQITPSAGSINWLTNWEIDSAASGFDNSSGSDSDYDDDHGYDVETSAIASTDKTFTATTASSNTNTLHAKSDKYLPDSSGNYATTYAASTMYREFEITGGAGYVDVTFSYDFTALLMGDATGNGFFSVDYAVNLEISDGVHTWDITSTDLISGSHTDTTKDYGDTLSDTFTLAYNTPYYISYNVDQEDENEGALCGCELVPDGIIWARGMTHGFEATVSNYTDQVQSFFFVTNITLLSGARYPHFGWLRGPYGITLDPYESKSAHLTLFVPDREELMSLGMRYVYNAYIGTSPSNVYDTCHFDFEVVCPSGLHPVFQSPDWFICY